MRGWLRGLVTLVQRRSPRQHFSLFFPLPQGQGALRPILGPRRTGCGAPRVVQTVPDRVVQELAQPRQLRVAEGPFQIVFHRAERSARRSLGARAPCP